MPSTRSLCEYGARELVERKRLRHASATGLLDEPLARIALHITGKEDDASRVERIALDERLIHLIPADIRHAEIEQNHVVATSLEQRICLGATGRGIHRVTEASEIPNDGGSNRSLVVDDEDAERATARRSHVWLGDDVSGLTARRYRLRQLDDERGAGARGFHADGSAVLPHDSVGDGQAKARSLANAFC